MKTMLKILIIGLSMTLFCTSAYADDYADTRKMFEDAGIGDMFNSAYGYALFPTIGKAGFVVGGAYGKGRVYEQGKHIGNTSMTQATVGFQLGGAGFSQVVFFQDKRAYDEFTSGEFEFGATAQAVAITAGAQAKAGTEGATAGASAGPKTGVQANAKYHKGMVTFVHAKGGLMYEVSIGGQKFTFKPL